MCHVLQQIKKYSGLSMKSYFYFNFGRIMHKTLRESPNTFLLHFCSLIKSVLILNSLDRKKRKKKLQNLTKKRLPFGKNPVLYGEIC